MLFSSMTFIGMFLPIICFIYFFARKEFRNYILLVASILFYGWGEPRYLAVMLITIIINYLGALLVSESKYKKISLFLTILADLSFLFYFKYFNFFVENLNLFIHSHIDFIKVIMPIGISFYTFQAISYVVDVYRGEIQVQKDIYKLALYISLFPQLVAGPIVKYHDVADQIDSRVFDIYEVSYGVKRFIVGLSKKVLIANTVGAVADKIFSQPAAELDFTLSWLGAVCYTLQIYYDFSGYSDMAIGLGRIFGFKFLENFNYPFISKSISEYWRRWHIALGSWFRDYMFLPLSRFLTQTRSYSLLVGLIGRKKTNILMTFIALFIVWFFTGFWHGASWTFIVWGLYNGFFIFIEILTGWNRERRSLSEKVIQHLYALFVIVTSFVIFRSDTVSYAWNFFFTMLGLKNGNPVYPWLYYVDNLESVAMAIGMVCSVPVFKGILFVQKNNPILVGLIDLWLIALFILSVSFIAAGTYNPFIYFRF